MTAPGERDLTPGQAAYEAFRLAFPNEDWGPWERLSPEPMTPEDDPHAGWEAVAQAGHAAAAAGGPQPQTQAVAQTIDNEAAAFAKAHGSFDLHFDAGQNYVRPDDCPWSLILDGQENGWGGFTAEEALEFAAAELVCSETAPAVPFIPLSDGPVYAAGYRDAMKAVATAAAQATPQPAPGFREAIAELVADWREGSKYRPADTRDEITEGLTVNGCADSLAAILDEHPMTPAAPQAAPEGTAASA